MIDSTDSQVFCLVLLPYTLASLEDEGLKTYERYRRKNIGNQIGLCPTASVEHSATERSQAAARMALGQTCGIEVSDLLREEKVQREQRQQNVRGAGMTALKAFAFALKRVPDVLNQYVLVRHEDPVGGEAGRICTSA